MTLKSLKNAIDSTRLNVDERPKEFLDEARLKYYDRATNSELVGHNPQTARSFQSEDIGFNLVTNFNEWNADIFPPEPNSVLWENVTFNSTVKLLQLADRYPNDLVGQIVREIGDLRLKRDEAGSKLGNLEGRLERAQLELWQYAAKKTHSYNDSENAELRASLQEARRHIGEIYSSTSWRITQPLRDIVMFFRAISKINSIKSIYNIKRYIKSGRIRELPAVPSSFKSGSKSSKDLERRGKIPRIVAIGDGPIPSIILSLVIPLSEMAKEGVASYSLHYENDFPVDEILSNADIIFMKRVCSAAAVEAASTAIERGIPLVYMVDDDFSEIPVDTPLGRRYAEMDAWKNVQTLCSIADRTVVWSDALEEKLSPYAGKILRFAAFSNVEIFDQFPKKKKLPNQPLTFGYAGGASHAPDLEILREPLIEFLDRNPEYRFETIGLKCEWLSSSPQYTHVEGSPDLTEYYRILFDRGWDFAVVPLLDTKFNASKSDNKLREYSACGVPAIYSDVKAYSGVVKHLETGVLVPNEKGAWVEALSNMASDSTLRQKIKHITHDLARTRYGKASVIRQFSGLVRDLVCDHNVLAVGPTFLPTFAIDVKAPFRLLRENNFARLRCKDLSDVKDTDLDWCNTLVIVRSFSDSVRDLVRRAQSIGVKVIYSWDDNWFEHPNDGSPLATELHDPENRKCLADILTEVDVVKATTPPIVDKSFEYSNKVVSYPYGFDFSLVENRMPIFRRDGRIRIGYFGTPGRDSQFNLVLDALKRLKALRKNVDFEFFGFNPSRAGELTDVKLLPFVNDYESSVRMLHSRRWDIGLAPLLDNSFNRSKLPTKYRDYAAVGAVGLYSDMEAYNQVVKNWVTGVLVGDSIEEWFGALVKLVDDDFLRETMATAAAKHVKATLSVERAAENWKSLLTNVQGFSNA